MSNISNYPACEQDWYNGNIKGSSRASSSPESTNQGNAMDSDEVLGTNALIPLPSSLQPSDRVSIERLLDMLGELPSELQTLVLTSVISRSLAYDPNHAHFALGCRYGAVFLGSTRFRFAAIAAMRRSSFQLGKFDIEGATCKQLIMFQPQLLLAPSMKEMSNLNNIHFTFRRSGVEIIDSELLATYSLLARLPDTEHDFRHSRKELKLSDEENNKIYNFFKSFVDASLRREMPYDSVMITGVAWLRRRPHFESMRVIRIINQINSKSTTFPVLHALSDVDSRYLNPIYPWSSYSIRLEQLHAVNQDALYRYQHSGSHPDSHYSAQLMNHDKWWSMWPCEDKFFPLNHTTASHAVTRIAVLHYETPDVISAPQIGPPGHSLFERRGSSIKILCPGLDTPSDDFQLLSLLQVPSEGPRPEKGNEKVPSSEPPRAQITNILQSYLSYQYPVRTIGADCWWTYEPETWPSRTWSPISTPGHQ